MRKGPPVLSSFLCLVFSLSSLEARVQFLRFCKLHAVLFTPELSVYLMALYFAVIVQCWLFASLSVATGSSEPKPELSAIEDRSAVDIVERTSAHRRLVAARDASLLMARDFSAHEFLKYNHELHYIDGKRILATFKIDLLIFWAVDSTSSFDSDGINPDQVPFAAHVQLASKLPTLLLESADMHFDRIVSFSKGTISLLLSCL